MSKFVVALGVVVCALFLTTSAFADTFTFTPYDSDLQDLVHQDYYAWMIHWSIPQDQVIESASLNFNNIWDWTPEQGDHLYANLLNNKPKGGTFMGQNSDTKAWYWVDNEGGGDNWKGHPLIGKWSDPNGGDPSEAINLTFNFTNKLLDDLTKYDKNGVFGIGIDPDCHYYNNGIFLTIITGPNSTPPVPEPISSSLFLLGAGALGLKLFRKNGRKA